MRALASSVLPAFIRANPGHQHLPPRDQVDQFFLKAGDESFDFEAALIVRHLGQGHGGQSGQQREPRHHQPAAFHQEDAHGAIIRRNGEHPARVGRAQQTGLFRVDRMRVNLIADQGACLLVGRGSSSCVWPVGGCAKRANCSILPRRRLTSGVRKPVTMRVLTFAPSQLSATRYVQSMG